jgi:DNA-binding NarL/FixJ family response regulator
LTSVLICDDRPLVAGALRETLRTASDLEVAGLADSGVHALILVRSHRPDVVVAGPRVRGMTGLDLARRVRSGDVPPAVVLYAADDSDTALGEALRAGVDGVLGGDASGAELIRAVRTVAEGNAMLAPSAARRLLGWFRDRPHESVPAPGTLSDREREVVVLAAEGLSTDDIARKLTIGTATVRTHLYRVRTKLQLRDRAALVSYAYRAGLLDRR